MERIKQLVGAVAPTFTVFKENGALDDDGQRRLVDFLLLSESISAYFIRSGMGLMYTFSMEDVRQIARNLCKHLDGIAPVLVGTSGIWDRNYDRLPEPHVYIEQGIELGNYAMELGAAGAVYTVPECLKPHPGETEQEMIERYFQTICDRVPGPVFIYQPPGTLPEYLMQPPLFGRLADIKNMAGAKISSTDGYYTYEMMRAVRGKRFRYIVGCESMFYAGLGLGARACIGQATIVNPQIIKAMWERFCAGNYTGVLRAQDAINTLYQNSPNPVDFLKMYATEKGYTVPLYNRSQASNPYATDRAPITREEYVAFKMLYETELLPYL